MIITIKHLGRDFLPLPSALYNYLQPLIHPRNPYVNKTQIKSVSKIERCQFGLLTRDVGGQLITLILIID